LIRRDGSRLLFQQASIATLGKCGSSTCFRKRRAEHRVAQNRSQTGLHKLHRFTLGVESPRFDGYGRYYRTLAKSKEQGFLTSFHIHCTTRDGSPFSKNWLRNTIIRTRSSVESCGYRATARIGKPDCMGAVAQAAGRSDFFKLTGMTERRSDTVVLILYFSVKSY
jgi:hypothetical protein